MTAPASLPIALRAEGVAYAYGRQPAIKDVSLELPAGAITAIVGPNGCGKSTLLKILMGELRPFAGRVWLAGRLLPDLPPLERARSVALVPQHASVAFNYCVREIVLMGRWPRQGGLALANAADDAAVNQAMWTLDVHHLAERPIHTLSGGERQRVTIARALAQTTPILLLDEPTSALDLFHQLEILHHLHQLAGEGKAIGLVTHDLNLALRYAHHAVLMDYGKIIAAGPAAAVLTPANIQQVYRVTAQPARFPDAHPLLTFTRFSSP